MTPVQLPLPNRLKWTVKEFERLTEMGAFSGQKIELIEGEMVEKMSQNEPHVWGIFLMQKKLVQLFGDTIMVRAQAPLRLENSKPEPDVAVVEMPSREERTAPSTALLVIEVSDTTLEYDRDTKSHIYARAQIAEYWIVNLNARQIEVRRDPRADETAPLGWTYGSLQTLGAGDQLTALSRPDSSFLVADVLP